MRRFFVYISLFLMILPCYADNYNKVNDYLYFDVDTFKTDYVANASGCFSYFNKERAIITGKVFNYEVACLEKYAGNVYIKTSYYFFSGDNYIKSENPYYFNRYDVMNAAWQYLDSYNAKYIELGDKIRMDYINAKNNSN